MAPRSAPTPDGAARLDVLGVVELRAGGRTVPTGGQVQTTILTHLALQAPRRVAVDAVIDAVWGDEPPATVRHSLSTQLSRLRRIVEAVGWGIRWTAQGYLLEAPEVATDSAAFELLVRDAENLADTGRARSAIETYRAALALWRGDPLLGLSNAPFVDATRSAMSERRRQAEDALAGLLLHSDRPAQAVALLDELARTTPLDERRWSMLVEALDRAGRPSEALAAAQNARRRLREELGLVPGAPLRESERRVLDRIAARPLPNSRPFFGRVDLVQRVLSTMAEARDHGPRVILVRGATGTGRTALLEEIDQRSDTTVHHWTWRLDPAEHTTLGTIHRSVAQQDAAPREPFAAGSLTRDRARLVHRTAEDLRTVADEHGALLLVDDLDRADGALLALVRDLALGRASAMLIVATVDIDPPGPVARLTEEIVEHGQGEVVDLDRLEPADAAELALACGTPRSSIDEVVRLSGGVPGRIVDAAREHRTEATTAPGAGIPGLLAAVAAAGPDATVSLLAKIVDRYPSVVLAEVQSAVAAGTLLTAGGPGDAVLVRFAHDAERERTAATTPLARRRALHLLTARSLRARGGDRSAIAGHLLEAGDLVDPDELVDSCLDGASTAIDAGAIDSAHRLLQAAAAGTGHRRLVAMVQLAGVEFARGDSEAGMRLAAEVFAEAVAVDRWDLAADAILAETNLGFPPNITAGREWLVRIDSTLDHLGASDHLRRMRLLVWKAHVAANLDHDLAADALDDADQLAPLTGPHRIDIDAARVRLLASRRTDPVAEMTDAAALGARCAADEDPLGTAMSRIMWTTAAVRAGVPVPPEALEYTLELCRAAAYPAAEYYALAAMASVTTAAGTMPAAELTIDRAEEFGTARHMPGAFLTAAMQRWPVRREQARLAEYADLVAELARTSDREGSALFHAATQHELGDSRPAPGIVERFVRNDLPRLAVDWVYDGHVVVAADLVADLGLTDLAPTLLDALARTSGTIVVYGSTSMALGPSDRAAARLASLLGDADLAGVRIEAARDLAERSGSALWEGWCTFEATRIVRMTVAARRRSLDRAAALALEVGSARLATAVARERR
ncbi:MAG: BTAD domain-containing putative transcriptional regulator [Actinomycetes bacterium]